MTDKDPLEYDHAKNTILSLEKPLTFTQLREQSKINPTTLNRRIKSLMENNYIDKIIDKEDKKPKYCLTEKGMKIYRSLTGTNTFEEIFGQKFINNPIVDILGEIAQFYKQNPDKTVALNNLKDEVIEKLVPLLQKIFSDIELDVKFNDKEIKEFLNEGWNLILEKWTTKKEEKELK